MAPNLSSRQIQKVILHGGLGNQLFQWSYGHQLALSGCDIEYIFYKRPYIFNHTMSSLNNFIPGCEHGNFREIKLPKNPLIRLVIDPVHSRNILSKTLCKVMDTTSNPFVYPQASSGLFRNIHFGLYQASNSVKEVKDLVLTELWKVLDGKSRYTLEDELSGAEVIHIRGGDYFAHSNMKSIGVLSSNYYSQIPPKKERLRIILTNDVKGAAEISKNLAVDGVFGPTDLDAYQSLGVMARASRLFTANSTLSWWGGLLAQSRGAQVVIPKPFFRNFLPDPKDSFEYPGFRTMDARFLD